MNSKTANKCVSTLYITHSWKKFTNPFLYAFVSFYRIFSPWGLNFVDSLFTSLWNNVSFNKQFTLIEIIDYLKVQVYRTLKIYLEPFFQELRLWVVTAMWRKSVNFIDSHSAVALWYQQELSRLHNLCIFLLKPASFFNLFWRK